MCHTPYDAQGSPHNELAKLGRGEAENPRLPASTVKTKPDMGWEGGRLGEEDQSRATRSWLLPTQQEVSRRLRPQVRSRGDSPARRPRTQMSHGTVLPTGMTEARLEPGRPQVTRGIRPAPVLTEGPHLTQNAALTPLLLLWPQFCFGELPV